MLGQYARYGGFKVCGILLHAQLSFWGSEICFWQTVIFRVLFVFVIHDCLLLQSQALLCPAASVVSESWKMNLFCEHMYQLLLGAASGGSESGKMTSFCNTCTSCCVQEVRI